MVDAFLFGYTLFALLFLAVVVVYGLYWLARWLRP